MVTSYYDPDQKKWGYTFGSTLQPDYGIDTSRQHFIELKLMSIEEIQDYDKAR